MTPEVLGLVGDETDLPKGWRVGRLDELAEFNPEQVGASYRFDRIVYLDISSVSNGTIERAAVLPLATAPSRAKRIARDGDTLLSTVRPGNRAFAFLRAPPDNLVCSTGFAVLRAKPKTTDPRFVYYLASSPPVIDYLASIAEEKTAYPSVNPEDIAECEVPIPPIAEQRAIASILGSLDDKIELNRRMNQTLEEIARALFKFWFVDFGPVRAKKEGRWKKGESLPGMPADMWDLWPSGFEESELGKIPKGWRLVRLAERCSTQYGFTASATDEAIGPRFLRVTDINKFPWIDWQSVPYCSISETERPKYTLSEGDILVARMADPGKCAIVEGSENAVFASYLVRLRVDSLARAYYTFYFLRSDEYQEYAEGARSGSVQANMNARVLVDVLHLDPPTWVLNAFLDSILPLRRKLALDLAENATLSQLRDALLPKLLSGEIRVPVNGGR